MAKENIGLIGAGLLGTAIAERLLAAGFDVLAHDVRPERGEVLPELAAGVSQSAANVADRCRRIVFCLPDSQVVAQVLTEILPHLHSGQNIIDTTTGDPETARACGERLAARDAIYIDATVLGSSVQMRDGEAVLMVGGESGDIDQCRDLFDALAREVFHVGPRGSGQLMKLVANLVLGLNRAVLAEGLALARSHGLDLPQVLKILQAGAAYSRAMDTKGEKMIQGDFAPQARLSQHLKDVQLILALAERNEMRLPLSEAHRELLRRAEELGAGQLDNSAIIKAWDRDVR